MAAKRDEEVATGAVATIEDEAAAAAMASLGLSSPLVFSRAHTPIHVERLGAHPTADEHDHVVRHICRVKGSSEAGAKRVPGVKPRACTTRRWRP